MRNAPEAAPPARPSDFADVGGGPYPRTTRHDEKVQLMRIKTDSILAPRTRQALRTISVLAGGMLIAMVVTLVTLTVRGSAPATPDGYGEYIRLAVGLVLIAACLLASIALTPRPAPSDGGKSHSRAV